MATNMLIHEKENEEMNASLIDNIYRDDPTHLNVDHAARCGQCLNSWIDQTPPHPAPHRIIIIIITCLEAHVHSLTRHEINVTEISLIPHLAKVKVRITNYFNVRCTRRGALFELCGVCSQGAK